MNKQEYMDCEDKALLHTYNRFPLVLDHGEGVYLYDTDGKKYLDFAAGIAVEALGYSNEAYKQALKDQIDKITHTSNLYYNVPIMEAAEKFLKVSKMDRVFSPTVEQKPLREQLRQQKICLYQRWSCRP